MSSLRLPPENLEALLLELMDIGLFTSDAAQDVLAARELLLGQLDDVAADFEGFAAATVDAATGVGTADTLVGIFDWLEANNPDGRQGYFTYVFASS